MSNPSPKRYIHYAFGSGPGKPIAVPEFVYRLVNRLVAGKPAGK